MAAPRSTKRVAAASILVVAVGAIVIVGLAASASVPEDERAQVMAKLTAAGFTKITLRSTVSDWETCGEYSRRFAALDRSGDVMMGLVCCVGTNCEVKY